MLIDDILDFIFPRYCIICNKRLTQQEKHICIPCYSHMPRTMFHTVEHSDFEKQFWVCANKVTIGRAVSFFYYTDTYKEILLNLKYKNNPDIGTYIASQYVKEIEESGFFDDIDMIIPIPLHWIRRWKRGYNQSYFIAEGISKMTGIPICTKAVKRVVNNKSQTLMRSSERHDNVENIFRLVHPEMLTNKHILIVDDVTTTGSTIISCIGEIAKATNVKVSVLALAYAGQTLVPQNNLEPLPSVSISVESLSKL